MDPEQQTEGAATALDLLLQFQNLQGDRAHQYSRFQAGFARYLESRQEGIFRSLMGDVTAHFAHISQQVIAVESALKKEGGAGRVDLAAKLRAIQECEREKLGLTLSLQSLRRAGAFNTFSWQQHQLPQHQLQDLIESHPQSQVFDHHSHGTKGASSCHDRQHHPQFQMTSNTCSKSSASPPPGNNQETLEKGREADTDEFADAKGLGGGKNDVGGGAIGAHDATSNGDGTGGGRGAPPPHVCSGPPIAVEGDLGLPADEPTQVEYEGALQEARQMLDRCVQKINDLLEELRYDQEDLRDL